MARRLKDNSLILSMVVAGFTLILLAMTGCSGDSGPSGTVAPAQDTADGQPVFIDTPAPATSLDDDDDDDDNDDDEYQAQEAFAAKTIKADEGGKVECGRFTVKIPAGALDSDTEITIRIPSGPYLICELEPHGIQFDVPVELTMNVEGLNTYPYTDWTIFWFDDAHSIWVDQNAEFKKNKLKAQLNHFSAYGGGRAGW